MASVRNPKKLYIANISRDAKDKDIGRLFEVCGRILSLEHKGDYGFVEFQDVSQAEEAIRRFDGTEFMGKRIVVEPYVYRGGDFRYRPAAAPNPAKFRARNISYRIYVTGLDNSTSWQDVKDFARSGGSSVCYTDVYTRRGKKEGVIEYFRREDFEHALRHLDGAVLNGARVNVYNERDYQKKRLRESSRSRSHGRDRDRDRERDRERGHERDRDNHDSNRRQHSGSRPNTRKRSHDRRSRSNTRKSRDRDNIKRDNDNYDKNKPSRSPNNYNNNNSNNNNNNNNSNNRNDKDKYDRHSRSHSRSPKHDSSNRNDRRINNHSRSPHDEKQDLNSLSTKQRNNRSKSPLNRSRSRGNKSGHDIRGRGSSNDRRRSPSLSN